MLLKYIVAVYPRVSTMLTQSVDLGHWRLHRNWLETRRVKVSQLHQVKAGLVPDWMC